MPQTVGANVARSARIADAYAIADANVREAFMASATSTWHEQQTIASLSKELQRKRDKATIAEEHQQAKLELLERRRQRMTELYTAEFQQLSKELNDMGLVIDKITA